MIRHKSVVVAKLGTRGVDAGCRGRDTRSGRAFAEDADAAAGRCNCGESVLLAVLLSRHLCEASQLGCIPAEIWAVRYSKFE